VAVNFPSSPTEGQVFNAPNGVNYKFVSGVWVVFSGATTWVQITQAAYNALSPPDANTLYVVVG